MRKSFIFLLTIFVCALGAARAAAQSEPNTTSNTVVSQPSLNAGEALEGSNTIALSASEIVSQISEARRLLSSRQTSASRDLVTVAAFDTETSQTSMFSLPKNEFLVKDASLSVTADQGRNMRVHVVRANGVNTAVTVTDESTGRSLVPLLVQFPIVKGGAVSEIAYYTSAHPALLSPALATAGKTYVRKMLDAAAARLAQDGVTVSPDIIDIAEHLCVVEHTDHKRFMSEDHSVLFPEILSLYALNEENTFRYSVSTAGAGGMIQMIPQTYKAIREQHSGVSLQSDFVSGMRDHANALEAMLLYINDTWNKLQQNTEVQDALRDGIATKPQLLAAGYNSNPGRLAGYLKNGGAEWRTLIPAETQIYLKIYTAVDTTLQLGSDLGGLDNALTDAQVAVAVGRLSGAAAVLSWLNRSLPFSGSFLVRFFY
jgi:hypothetical protein